MTLRIWDTVKKNFFEMFSIKQKAILFCLPFLLTQLLSSTGRTRKGLCQRNLFSESCAVEFPFLLNPKQYRSLAPIYYKGADVAIVVYDVTNEVKSLSIVPSEIELKFPRNNANPFFVTAIFSNSEILDRTTQRKYFYGREVVYCSCWEQGGLS